VASPCPGTAPDGAPRANPSGCERLAFVGLRLGALLAAHAAVARTDVGAFVALLPRARHPDELRRHRTVRQPAIARP
jgi:hypothetical protein